MIVPGEMKYPIFYRKAMEPGKIVIELSKAVEGGN